MGNCNEAREYDDVTTDNNNDKDEIEEALQTEKQILKLKHGSVVDPLYAHIKDCIPENVIFSENEKRFKKLYRIKKNLRSEKNFLYDLKVLEQKNSGQYFNAKIISKERILLIGEEYFRTMLKNELRSLSLLNENSCEILLKIYLLKNKNSFKLIIISNYCEQKSLLDIINEHIEKKQKFTDKEIASVGKQLILTAYRLKYLNIIHRNISPDNIYFIKSSNLKSLSLRNFYFSTQLGKTKSTNGVYGGLWYMSPEMIRDLKYDFKTDIWSIGVVLYIMITLENPFIHCESRENMIDKLKSKKLFMSKKELRFLGIDEDIVSIVYKILVENPTLRCGSEILLDEDIFKNSNLIEHKITKKEIYNFINYSDAFVEEFDLKTLKKESGLLLHALNYYLIFNLRNLFLDGIELMKLNEFFNLFDKTNNGFISFQEIEDILKIKLNSNNLFSEIDKINFNNRLIDNYKKLLSDILFVNDYVSKFHGLKNNLINFESFVTANLILKIFKNKNNEFIKRYVDILFDEIDLNDNNQIEIIEIQNFIKSKKNNMFKEINELIEQLEEKEKGFKFDKMNRNKFQKILNYDLYKIDKQDEEKIKNLKNNEKNDEKFLKKLFTQIDNDEKDDETDYEYNDNNENENENEIENGNENENNKENNNENGNGSENENKKENGSENENEKENGSENENKIEIDRENEKENENESENENEILEQDEYHIKK